MRKISEMRTVMWEDEYIFARKSKGNSNKSGSSSIVEANGGDLLSHK
jgi:hypothetical protein